MKYLKTIFLIMLIIFISADTIKVYAQEKSINSCNVTRLRAGGGGGGGTGGGGTGAGTGGHGNRHVCYHNNFILCIFDEIISIILFVLISSIGAIVLYFKIIRSSINSRKYMKLISKKDVSWKYKNIEKQVIETFYIVQESWTKMNMESAKDYMSEDLYEKFKNKIEWMEIANKRNILKKIKLINLKPVSVIDSEDDTKDLIWFYVKGSMIDYIINTKTNQIIDGKNTIIGLPFVEYWKFVRKDDRWVLSEIIQDDEKDRILFQ